jgi:hypothetical protein
MRVKTLISVAFASCCICVAAKNPWIAKKKDKEDNGFAELVKKGGRPTPPARKNVDLANNFQDDYASLFAGAGAGALGGDSDDLMKVNSLSAHTCTRAQGDLSMACC